jgi:hypothetical protein
MALADRIETALWGRQDTAAAALGFQVTRVTRWTRRYRHPRLAIALAARAARAHNDDRTADRSERAA